MLLDPQFFAEQVLNSLQFSMLLFLLAIGLSVVFGLMDYLNLSHGTIGTPSSTPSRPIPALNDCSSPVALRRPSG